jgi:hypothetical protein
MRSVSPSRDSIKYRDPPEYRNLEPSTQETLGSLILFVAFCAFILMTRFVLRDFKR